MQKNIKNVVIIEDGYEDSLMLQDAFGHASSSTNFIILSDGDKLPEYIATGSTPDIFIVDYNMPKVNGLECLKLTRDNKNFDDTSVVIYSTSSSPRDIRECYYFHEHSTFKSRLA